MFKSALPALDMVNLGIFTQNCNNITTLVLFSDTYLDKNGCANNNVARLFASFIFPSKTI